MRRLRKSTVLARDARKLATAEEVFNDFQGRRNGLITALTTDSASFYSQCSPDNVNLCLYGYPNGTWEVNLPCEELPEDLPEPLLGINFARDGMPKDVWLRLVAVHCDAWLLSLAFFFGAKCGFDKSDRNRLFDMINGLPTIFETVDKAVTESDKEQVETNANDEDDKKEKHGYKQKREQSEIMGWDGVILIEDARTVKDVFNEFKGRRAALITALTDDFESLYMQCDPEKDNLCLYGYPDGKWEVNFPGEELPLDLPEPMWGINFARAGMGKKEWSCLVAAYSDAWLLSLVFHLGAKHHFDKSDRNCLFDEISDLPTIYETVSEAVKEQGNLGVTTNESLPPKDDDAKQHGETLCRKKHDNSCNKRSRYSSNTSACP